MPLVAHIVSGYKREPPGCGASIPTLATSLLPQIHLFTTMATMEFDAALRVSLPFARRIVLMRVEGFQRHGGHGDTMREEVLHGAVGRGAPPPAVDGGGGGRSFTKCHELRGSRLIGRRQVSTCLDIPRGWNNPGGAWSAGGPSALYLSEGLRAVAGEGSAGPPADLSSHPSPLPWPRPRDL